MPGLAAPSTVSLLTAYGLHAASGLFFGKKRDHIRLYTTVNNCILGHFSPNFAKF